MLKFYTETTCICFRYCFVVVVVVVDIAAVDTITVLILTVPEFLYPFFFACFFGFMAYTQTEELVE